MSLCLLLLLQTASVSVPIYASGFYDLGTADFIQNVGTKMVIDLGDGQCSHDLNLTGMTADSLHSI